MTASETRTTIQELFDALGSGRWDDPEFLLGNFAADGEWWVAGSFALSGVMSRAHMLEALRATSALAQDGLKITCKSWVIQGNRAAVEAEGAMRLRDGRRYNNQYHFAVEIRDGKIFRVREYMDTKHASDIFGT